LEAFRADSTPGPRAWGPPSDDAWPHGDQSLIGVRAGERVPVPMGWGYDSSGIDADAADRELIVTLHRTIDAQLAYLRDALGHAESEDRYFTYEHAINIADAILGGAE